MERHHRIGRGQLVLAALFYAITATPGVAQIIVLGPLNEQLELEPGSRHSGSIMIRNGGEEAEDIRLVQYDYRVNHQGENFYTDVGTVERSNAEWISISPRQFRVPPGETSTISYTIDVPDDESLAGTYWSVLMIEPVPETSPESPDYEPGQVGVGITSILRYAFTFVTSIGSTGSIIPEVIGATLRYVEDTPVLDVDIENGGTRILRIAIWAELYDGDGTLVGRYPGNSAGLLPLSSLRYNIPLIDAPLGSYNGLVIIDCGDNNVFGASFPIAIE
jgi:hypothetical protein